MFSNNGLFIIKSVYFFLNITVIDLTTSTLFFKILINLYNFLTSPSPLK